MHIQNCIRIHTYEYLLLNTKENIMLFYVVFSKADFMICFLQCTTIFYLENNSLILKFSLKLTMMETNKLIY